MGLTIEGATVGYDSRNVTAALNNLNTQVIQATITDMNTGLSNLYDTVNAAWVGQSAEVFKENMQADVRTITEGLNHAYATLQAQMHQIVNNMEEIDQNLVQRRQGGAN